MSISNVIALLGGVALFLFGMSLMGDGLKKVAGNKLEYFLYHLSNTPIKGILLGTGVTAVIQSSSATSVLVVGFVNSGMMKLKQAIGIVMGAIIGTSITGWIICLSSFSGSGSGSEIWELISTDTLTGVIAVVGIILRMFSKKVQKKHLGDIMLGFAVLMFGIAAMSQAVYPLRESEAFISLLTAFSNPFLGILIGLVFTSILQSASAAVGILQALAVTGAIQFQVAFPIIMGIAIGAAVPVLLSAIGANVAAKRTALSYLMVDTIGVVICSGVFYVLNAIFDFAFMDTTMTAVSIAFLNTIFRIVIVLIQAPFIGVLAYIVTRLVKDNSEEEQEGKIIDLLEERFLSHTSVAIEQSRLVICSMADKTEKNLNMAFSLLEDYSEKGFKKVEHREDLIDKYEDKLGTYLMKLAGREMTDSQKISVGIYLHAITDFERIGDHAMNVAESAQEIHEKGLVFSDEARKDLDVLVAAITDVVAITGKSFKENDVELAYRIEPFEQCIDEICDEIKLRHIYRLQSGFCNLEKGFPFNDLMNDLERISDHCANISEAIIEMGHDSLEMHKLADKRKEAQAHHYDEYYREYRERYAI